MKDAPINRRFPGISLEFIPTITKWTLILRRSPLIDLLCHFNAHDDGHAPLNGARPPLLVCQLEMFSTVINGQNKGTDIHIFL